ncbi:membrane protein [Bacteroidia bacterium]|nr:membrane protein [Bacteroidia bacterium]
MGLAIIPAVIAALFLVLFLALFKVNRTKIAMGFMFTCFLFSLLCTALVVMLETKNPVLGIFFVGLLLLFIPLVLFGAYILVTLLLLNARAVLSKERRSLSNCLTLLLAAAMIIHIAMNRFIDPQGLPGAVQALLMAANFAVFYYMFHLSQYLVSLFIFNRSRPRKNQDYIIVLGCWLNNGSVTPLLSKRIDRAIDFYNNQKQVAKPPKLIFSGGKGSDESRSEASAMAEYALSKGIPQDDVILEDESVSTQQNMVFSKRIMDAGHTPYNAVFATSGYHLLRAGIYARRAGLKINGIGAKTKLYYLPNAILREYIAYLYMYRKHNAVVGALVFMCGAAVKLLTL